jgi:hypothetical protein
MPTTNFIWDEQNYLAETDQNNVIQTVYTNEPQQYGIRAAWTHEAVIWRTSPVHRPHVGGW